MSNPIFRHGLDLTGFNPDNFVNNEHHVLANRKNRAIAPKSGTFFADSLVLIETNTNRILTRGTHYVPVELHQILSIKTGKDVFGALLIIDRSISANVHISYQCVGGEQAISADTLFSLLEKIPDDSINYGWFDVINKPDTFPPAPHLHPIGEAYGFEHINHQLDKIRNAILWKNIPTFNNLLTFINDVIRELNYDLKFKMDVYFGPNLIEFRNQINAAFYGLDKVLNIEISTEEEARIAARMDTTVNNFSRSKYMALNAVIAFKNSIHNTFVSGNRTNIGKDFALNIPPDAKTILLMNNGTVNTIVSKNDANLGADDMNISIYPPDVDPTHSFTIMKISNNKESFGGVWLLVEKEGRSSYFISQNTGDLNDPFIYKRLTLQPDMDNVISLINDHITASETAHDVTKDQIELSEVENLPVVTRVEVLQLDNVRKYVTMDTMLLFMKTFMIGKRSSEDTSRDGTVNPLESVDIHACNQCIADAEAINLGCIPCGS